MVLENPFQELGFSSADLRVHMDRADGTWLRPPKQEIINIEEDCEKQSEHDDDKTAYLSKVVHEKDKSSRKRGREMNAQVTRQKVAAAVDQEEEKQTSVKKSRENPLEQSASRNTTSTAKKQNMPAPETEETVPNNSNKFRMENCPNILSRDECRTTLMSMDSTEKVTESARAKCSTFGTNGNGMAESSNKRGRGLNAPVPATAAEEDKTNEGSAEVINGGSVQNFNQSSAVNVKAESEPVRDKNLPFVKSSYMWKEFDSQEVFRILPQTPHFSHLSDCHEETREGLAIGHMVTFASVVEKVSKLQIEDPTSHFVSYLEALDILQEIGFDVKAVVDRVNDLLSLKTRQEQFHEHSKTYQSLVVECDEKKAKLEEENTAIDKMIGELEAKRAANVSQIVKEDSTRDFLQLRASTIEDFMLDMKKKFKVKSAAPWQRLI